MTYRSSEDRPSAHEARELLLVLELGARLAGARPGGDPSSEDVAQIAVEKILTKWNDPHVVKARDRGPPGWRNYLIRVAKNAFLDVTRSDRRRKTREERASRGTDGGHLSERPGTIDASHREMSDTDKYLARRLIVDLIDECELSELQRNVAILHLVGGLLVKEIAAELGVSEPRVRRAKRVEEAKLAQRLKDGASD